MNELISVITPFYNSEKLVDAVASVAAQDYPKIELIIIDDCSNPETANRCREKAMEIADGKLDSFLWLTHAHNQGTVRTVNEAWKTAKGKYIFTLAHDDVFWNEKVLSNWVRAFERTNADVMVGYRAVYDPELINLGYLSPSPAEEKMLRDNAVKKIQKRLYRYNFIFGCTVARTRDSVEKFGVCPEDYRLIEDYPMILRLFRMGAKICLFEQVVVKYRSGGISLPSNVTDVYQNDTKLIYKKEILPYIKPRWYGKHLLNRQLREREHKRSYTLMRSRHDGALWNLYCHLVYPEFFFAFARTLSEKRSRKEQMERILSLSGNPAEYHISKLDHTGVHYA